MAGSRRNEACRARLNVAPLPPAGVDRFGLACLRVRARVPQGEPAERFHVRMSFTQATFGEIAAKRRHPRMRVGEDQLPLVGRVRDGVGDETRLAESRWGYDES